MANDPLVDMGRIYGIESSGNPRARNKRSGAQGLGQVTQPALDDWNRFNPGLQFSMDEMFNPDLNRQVSSWYMLERIPSMLSAYKLPVTTDNVLWAYNAGIGNVRKGVMPAETRDYIRKYHAGAP